MSFVTVRGTLTDPLGNPISMGLVRFTALNTVVAVPAPMSVAEFYTMSNGSYDFLLYYGAYKVELNLSDTYEPVSEIYIDEGTPSPITIEGLVNYASVRKPPVIHPDDPDWGRLHNALRNDLDTSERANHTQILDGDTYVTETQQLLVNDRLDADMAEQSKQVDARATARVDHQDNAYNDGLNNKSAISNTETSAGGVSAVSKQEVYEASNSSVTVYSVSEVSTPVGCSEDNLTIADEVMTIVQTKCIGDNKVARTKTISAESMDDVKTTTFNTVGSIREDESFVEEYVDGTFRTVNQPKVETNKVLTYGSDEISHGSLALIDFEGNKQLSTYMGTSVDSRKTNQTHSNDGLESRIDTTADIYQINDQDGNSVLKVDTVNKRIDMDAQLFIGNPDDFKGDPGDTIFEVFKYAETPEDPPDGRNWHDDFNENDKWRIFNQSINGIVDPATWSDPVLLQANDGHDGDTLYFAYQYSVDGSSFWHDTLEDGDFYRREALVTNGVFGPWSDASKIVGSDGDNGEIVFPEYLYSIDGLGVPPVDDTDPSNGWHSNFTTGDHYSIDRLVKYAPGTVIPIPVDAVPIEITPWTLPALMTPRKGYEYFDGAQGSGSYVIEIPLADRPTTDADVETLFRSELGKPSSEFDIVTFTGDVSVDDDDQFADQYIRNDIVWDGSNNIWETFALVVDGNTLINGTVAATALVAKTITGDYISSTTTIIAGEGVTTSGMNGNDLGDFLSNRYKNSRFWSGSEFPRSTSGDIEAPFHVGNTGNVRIGGNFLLDGNAQFQGNMRIGQLADVNNYVDLYGNTQAGTADARFLRVQDGGNEKVRWDTDGRLRMWDNQATPALALDFNPATGVYIFNGQIQADEIVGDIVSAITKTNGSITLSYTPASGQPTTRNFGSVSVLNARPYIRTLSISVWIEANVESTGIDGNDVARARAYTSGSFGAVYSQWLIAQKANGVNMSNGNSSMITLNLTVPANTTGTANINLQSNHSATSSGNGYNCDAVMRAPASNNQWTTSLFRTGVDLG